MNRIGLNFALHFEQLGDGKREHVKFKNKEIG